jgi:hypothetical protein
MTVKTSDVFIFYDGEAVEKAVEKMRRAMGKKNEAQAAVKFARAMLSMTSERETIEDEGDRRRFDLLFAYYRIHEVRIKILDLVHSTSEIANKVYSQFRDLGGDHDEEEAYRTGKTIEEIREKRRTEKYDGINTRDKQPEKTEKSGANE